MSIVAAALIMLSTGAVETAPSTPKPTTLRGPIRMKASQIKAYNEGLSKDDPAYIRCESQSITGSIAMRKKVCRTNKEWARITAEGNAAARRLVDDMNKGWTSGSPPAGDSRPGLPGG